MKAYTADFLSYMSLSDEEAFTTFLLKELSHPSSLTSDRDRDRMRKRDCLEKRKKRKRDCLATSSSYLYICIYI